MSIRNDQVDRAVADVDPLPAFDCEPTTVRAQRVFARACDAGAGELRMTAPHREGRKRLVVALGSAGALATVAAAGAVMTSPPALSPETLATMQSLQGQMLANCYDTEQAEELIRDTMQAGRVVINTGEVIDDFEDGLNPAFGHHEQGCAVINNVGRSASGAPAVWLVPHDAEVNPPTPADAPIP